MIDVHDSSLIYFYSQSLATVHCLAVQLYTLLHFTLLDGLSSSHNALLLDFCDPSSELKTFFHELSMIYGVT